MGYRFRLADDFGDAVHRIGREQIESAIQQMASTEDGVAVHETRKCLKRVRAMLRLVRHAIGETAYKAENNRYGDIGRMLSRSRDRAVLRSTLERLIGEHPEHGARLRRLKASVPADVARTRLAQKRLASRAGRALKAGLEDWRALQFDGNDFQSVEKDLARGVASLRKTMSAAGSDDDAVHDWRKAVQRHWRHMLLLREGWPDYFEARAAIAKQVSELLGTAQDMTLVIAHAEREAGANSTPDIISLVQARRDALRETARELCSRLVAESPTGHARRAGMYWAAAQASAVEAGERARRLRQASDEAALPVAALERMATSPSKRARAKPGPRGRRVRPAAGKGGRTAAVKRKPG